jgi:uncharacterized protein YjiS (DUF1127 family)
MALLSRKTVKSLLKLTYYNIQWEVIDIWLQARRSGARVAKEPAMKHLMLIDNMLNASHLIPGLTSGLKSAARRYRRPSTTRKPVNRLSRLSRHILQDIGLDDSCR